MTALKNPKGYEVSEHEAQMLLATATRPVLVHQFLPGCAKCHAPHPMARKPKLDVDACPDCGHPIGRGKLIAVSPKMTGVAGSIATAFFDFADWLTNLSKRL